MFSHDIRRTKLISGKNLGHKVPYSQPQLNPYGAHSFFNLPSAYYKMLLLPKNQFLSDNH